VAAEILLCIPDAFRHERAVQALGSGTVIAEPSTYDWTRAATALTRLGGEAVTKSRSFWNHALQAAQCARLGATLVTHNTADFRRFARLLGVRAVRPFP
jgi:predicted nucleic acid-binding protein